MAEDLRSVPTEQLISRARTLVVQYAIAVDDSDFDEVAALFDRIAPVMRELNARGYGVEATLTAMVS